MPLATWVIQGVPTWSPEEKKEEILLIRFLSYIKMCYRGHSVGQAGCISRETRSFRVSKPSGGGRAGRSSAARWLRSMSHNGPTYPPIFTLFLQSEQPGFSHTLILDGCSSVSWVISQRSSWQNEGWDPQSQCADSSRDSDLQRVNVLVRLHFEPLYSFLAGSPCVSQQSGVLWNLLPCSCNTNIKIC